MKSDVEIFAEEILRAFDSELALFAIKDEQYYDILTWRNLISKKLSLYLEKELVKLICQK